MMGMTGSRLVNKGMTHVVHAPQNVLNVQFPHMTVVKSSQLNDGMGRPTYRKDVRV